MDQPNSYLPPSCPLPVHRPHLSDSVLKALKGLVINPQESLGGALLGGDVLQSPDAVLVGKALGCHADLGEDPHLREGGDN